MKHRLYSALILLVNYYSAIYVLLGAAILYLFDYTPAMLWLLLLFWIYLFPPLLCRAFITLFGRPVGIVSSHSRVFLYWWFLTQLQVVFVRFPFLEELLRIFPGLYSLWLNLWGASVSLMTYWSPGVTVIDRYHINIGKGVIVGGGCRLGAHIITQSDHSQEHRTDNCEDDSSQNLTLAPLTIEPHSVIGIHASIGPGCHVYANETVPAGKVLKPFYAWKDGRIQRPPAAD